MTKQQAKRYICRCMATTIDEDMMNGSEYLRQDDDCSPLSDADAGKVAQAAKDLRWELMRRGRARG
jgi:hypothetical protein